ncbi:NAD-dependent epimerase/dehydratase family protein [Candidatus Obscuribacterales bacterium]|nr:NAD-dependent epimerase/dehydratase family protein [Candidatus Obscuribacterales bacterium]MBX3136773.1 NAD-dependent epimerase/dehydratase family protein [Candidatus Obscuribacterales bacterium]MBX3150798.1 NAD-dependent epimerase/dehydratase family protein [Candidatus Obscuribacterales bacterium]
MRVLLLGGTGFIGSHVVKQMAAKGHEVTVVHRGRSNTTMPEGVQSLLFDRRDLSEYAAQIRKLAPNVVIDMIPRTSQESWTLTRAIAGVADRMVVISSIDVYRAYNRLRKKEPGSPDATPLKENSPLREQLYPYRGVAVDALHTAYEYEKILVEKLAQSEPELQTTILRLPVVYGPNDPQTRIFEHLRRMDDGRKHILLGKQQAKWQLTRGYVDDVASAVVVASEDQSNGSFIYNIGEDDSMPEMEWVKLVGKAAGWQGEVLAVDEELLPTHIKQDYDWRQHLTIDTEPFRTKFNWTESVPRDEALALTVAWQRQNPPETVDLDKFDYDAEDEVLETKLKLASAKG